MLQTNLLAVLQTAACISWSPFTQSLLLLNIQDCTVPLTLASEAFLVLAENFLHHV